MNIEYDVKPEVQWSPFVERYRSGEDRSRIFRDMILTDVRSGGPAGSLTVLDIGCGQGLDNVAGLQAELASEAGRYIGVEPDESIQLGPFIQDAYRCPFEEAPIGPSTVDVAFSVMVLEHLKTPGRFWDKLRDVLRDGGVFWGFTIDSRNWFAKASGLAKALGLKDLYLDLLHGREGEGRYENYPVHYRSNTPDQVARLARGFRSVQTASLHKVGQLDYYFPRRLRGIGRSIDRYILRRGLPGSIMVVRAVK